MQPTTYQKMLSFLPFMKELPPMTFRLYCVLVAILQVNSRGYNEELPLHIVKLEETSGISSVKIASALKKLVAAKLVKLSGIGAEKNFCLLPPSENMTTRMENSESFLKTWGSLAAVKPTRTRQHSLRPESLKAISLWNELFSKPKITIPTTGSDGYHNCLSVHIDIDVKIGQFLNKGYTEESIMQSIVDYKNDPAVPETIRKKFSLAFFLGNSFMRGLPPSLCVCYMQNNPPFKSWKATKIPERPELIAQGLYNSLKSKFIMRYCGGLPDGIDERRDVYLTIGANNISAAIKRWAPLLKRKLQSSEWAEYVIQCLDEIDDYRLKTKKTKSEPFSALAQEWFFNKAFPMFLARKPACVLESYQVRPINPEEGGQVAAG